MTEIDEELRVLMTSSSEDLRKTGILKLYVDL